MDPRRVRRRRVGAPVGRGLAPKARVLHHAADVAVEVVNGKHGLDSLNDGCQSPFSVFSHNGRTGIAASDFLRSQEEWVVDLPLRCVLHNPCCVLCVVCCALRKRAGKELVRRCLWARCICFDLHIYRLAKPVDRCKFNLFCR